MTTALTADEIERYARHIVLPEIGGAGQQKLKQARVLVIGAGGLGAPVLEYLAAAGVGTLGIVDDDTVSLSNLQRQVIHGTDTIGMLKTHSAKAAIARINPNTAVETHTFRMTTDNAPALVARYDIIVDGSDNFETRYLVSDACYTAENYGPAKQPGISYDSLGIARSVRRIKALAANTGFTVWFGHDAEQFATVRKVSEGYYE